MSILKYTVEDWQFIHWMSVARKHLMQHKSAVPSYVVAELDRLAPLRSRFICIFVLDSIYGNYLP